jgi:phospholipid transport system substrate-binding protein
MRCGSVNRHRTGCVLPETARRLVEADARSQARGMNAAPLWGSTVRTVILKFTVVASLMLGTSVVCAEDIAPDVQLKALTAEVIGIVKRSRGDLVVGRTSEVNEVVERKVVPLFDFSRMTQIALAQNWRLATPDQREALTSEFKTLLVRTYSAFLRNYRDQIFDFKSVTVPSGATHATVNSVVKQPGTAGTPVDYQMERTPAGWKVYEICFDGVKLIENYRPTFAARVKAAGIDGLIKAISDKNRQGN